jgi:hypothetical protein
MLSRQIERLAEATRPRAQQRRVVDTPSRAHSFDVMRGLERSQKNGGSDLILVAHDVGAPVDPVRAVDVEPSARTEHRRVASCPTAVRMARRVVRRVRLRLDDDATDTVDEERPADEVASNGGSVAGE